MDFTIHSMFFRTTRSRGFRACSDATSEQLASEISNAEQRERHFDKKRIETKEI